MQCFEGVYGDGVLRVSVDGVWEDMWGRVCSRPLVKGGGVSPTVDDKGLS